MLASLLFVLFCLSDWMLLWALPRLQLSFSPGLGVPLGASLLVRSLVLAGLLAAVLFSRWGRRAKPRKSSILPAAVLFLTVNLGFSAAQIDAYVIEPLWVETTELSLGFEDLDSGAPPLRVMHITDTHIERNSFREEAVIRQVQAVKPDIVVLTGDYLNLSYYADATAATDFRHFVAQLEAPYGVYAVRGTVEPTPQSMARLVQGTGLVWLEQEAITLDVRGQSVTLVGVACSHQQDVDAARLEQALAGIPEDDFTLLLFHSPDLIREATKRRIDLYLGGHTHGGQLRLPVIGPIVTHSRYGRQYAAGQFTEGDTTMYISRGLGFEGGSLPRARFLCRPEIVSIELRGID